jgi:hypothetical protein
MQHSNDNFASEKEALRAKAREIVGTCSSESHHSCSLFNGGACPIVDRAVHGAMSSIVQILK